MAIVVFYAILNQILIVLPILLAGTMAATNMPLLRYWLCKLEEEGRQNHLAQTMVDFDEALGEWAHLEAQMGLIDLLGYLGHDASARKANSHFGKPDQGQDRGKELHRKALLHATDKMGYQA